MTTRSRTSLYLALVFLSGLVAGALVMNLGEHRWIHRGALAGAPDWGGARNHLLEQIKQELVLTPEQSRQMEAILDDTMREFEDLHTRAHRCRQEARERIRSILDEKQRLKFEEAMNKLQRRYGIQDN